MTRRLRACVEAWPDCETGLYNPACCRFPKSCSCTIWDPQYVTEADLEPETGGLVLGFFDNDEGERYVNLADLVVWCHQYAHHLKAQGEDKKADAVASVGLMLADQMEPEKP